MSRRTPRIRVDRLELIEVAEAKRRKVDTVHANALERNASQLEKYRHELVAALRRSADAIEQGKRPIVDPEGWVITPFKPMPDELPKRCPEAVYLEATIAGLRHGVDELVWLSRDDAAYYYGPFGIAEGPTP